MRTCLVLGIRGCLRLLLEMATHWIEQRSRRHPDKVYYYNTATKQSTWEKPTELSKKVRLLWCVARPLNYTHLPAVAVHAVFPGLVCARVPFGAGGVSHMRARQHTAAVCTCTSSCYPRLLATLGATGVCARCVKPELEAAVNVSPSLLHEAESAVDFRCCHWCMCPCSHT